MDEFKLRLMWSCYTEWTDYLLVIVDEYSRYPIVVIKSLSANSLIPMLDKVIAMLGVPIVIKTDNGSPFKSSEFSDYTKFVLIYIHRKITHSGVIQ